MHVLYLTPSGQLGGAETSLIELVTAVREYRPEWRLTVLVGEDGPLVAALARQSVEVIVEPMPAALATAGDAGGGAGMLRLPAAYIAATRYSQTLRNRIERLQPDVLHTNGLKMHVLGRWGRPSGTPLVWHIHDYVTRRPLARRLLARCRGVSGVIANSDSVAQDIRRVIGSVPQVHRIYNAVDMNRFSPVGGRADLDALCGLPPAPDDAVRVGIVATFARWKGHLTFLRALAQLPRDLNYRAYIIGGPIYQTAGSQFTREELASEAHSLGVADKLAFTGFISDASTAMRSLDIVVHASTSPEPFGMAIVEGMACERAVIASAAGGAAEIIDDGVSALGHAPGDHRQLAECLVRLIQSRELRASLATTARRSVEQRFTRIQMASELVPLYSSLKSPHTALLTAVA